MSTGHGIAGGGIFIADAGRRARTGEWYSDREIAELLGFGAGGMASARVVSGFKARVSEKPPQQTLRTNCNNDHPFWSNIVPTADTIPGTPIPSAFEMRLPNNRWVWVHPNATKHLKELVLRVPAGKRSMEAQMVLSDFRGAVAEAASQRYIVHDKMVNVNRWEIKFGMEGSGGDMIQVFHAVRR